MAEIHDQMKAKLEKLGLSAEKITVFGVVKCNVHVICNSRITAYKWAVALSTIFKVKATVTKTAWCPKDYKGTCFTPSMRRAFLVAVAG